MLSRYLNDPKFRKFAGKCLEAKRTEKRWSQEHVAGMAGVSSGTVSNIEAGQKVWTKNFAAVAKALAVNPILLRRAYRFERDRDAYQTFFRNGNQGKLFE